jgi:hypothetical protein
MMTENISRRDWERLSAYLDKQLSAKESAHLTARLQTDLLLLAAFKELQMARNMLKQLPYIKAPRNFTLTPEMVGARKPQPSRWYPAFRFASMLTSLLFVFIIVGDFFSGGTVTMQQDMASPAIAPAVEVAVEESIETELVSDDAYLDAEIGVLETEPGAEMAPAPETVPVVEMEAINSAEGFAAEEDVPVEKSSGDVAEEPEAAITESPAPLDETDNQEREMSAAAPEEAPSVVESQTDYVDLSNEAESASPVSEPTGILWLLLLKIIFGAAAVVTTTITFFLRQRAH